MQSTLHILEYAMTMEKQGQQFYQKYQDEIEGERFRETFADLARVEEEHYFILKKAHEKLQERETLESITEELSGGDTIFENILQQEKAMLDPEADISLNDMAVLRMAYLVENDFVEFYRSVAEKTTSPQAKTLLSTLAEWENKHKDLFYREYRDLMEAKWGEQQFAPF